MDILEADLDQVRFFGDVKLSELANDVLQGEGNLREPRLTLNPCDGTSSRDLSSEHRAQARFPRTRSPSRERDSWRTHPPELRQTLPHDLDRDSVDPAVAVV